MSRIQSSRQNHFAITPAANHPRSAFKCDHGYKTTFNAGYLIPFLWDEVQPGDTFKVSATAFIRFATLLFPLMDNCRFYTHYFFVPTRLIWNNSRKFFGEQANPGDSIAYTVPKMVAPVGGYAEGSIYDYLGLPTKVAGFSHISLPLRSFNIIYNEWFRDQNLQNSVTELKDDANDPVATYNLLRSCKIRDYFTSGLPSAQKGNPVSISLTGNAPVIGDGTQMKIYPNGAPLDIRGVTGSTNTMLFTGATMVPGTAINFSGGAIADLSNVTAANINQLRTAFQIQRFLERDMRNGTRYAELVNSHFGVHFPDLHYRPLYLGGSNDPLNISVVAQTSGTGQTGQTTPLANLAGYGTAVLHDHGFTQSFTEHGIVMGIIVARADINYQNGLNRKWSRSIRYDYPWPVFAHLGEQAVLNKEIYTQGTAADDQVFCYQERYAENRYFPNLVTSLFRSNATGTLDSWHLAQDFSSLPTLGATFIVDNPPTTRVKATASDPDFIMDMQIRQTVVSCLPSYSVPGYIDHF
ncbi:MAG: major capsid protein [Arizlama microvirus]|nr:MAG: major capsid protein [Arizlama microvirus]